MSLHDPIKMRPPPALPHPLTRVCPILTLATPQKEPSALVTKDGPNGTLNTVNCIGMKCALFHPGGACSLMVMGDALLTQAQIMVNETAAVEPPPSNAKEVQ